MAFDVYRSYLPEAPSISTAPSSVAAKRRPELKPALDQLVRGCTILATSWRGACSSSPAPRWRRALRTPPYYRYARFVALNEVGGNPDQFGIPVEEFHRLQAIRQDQRRIP